jgi:hypothetical protein
MLLTVLTAGCGRAVADAAEPTPTYIPQPTPDSTMSAVIQSGQTVSFLPPLEVKGSPTPAPARAAQPAGGGRTAPKPAPTAREAAPARAAAPTREPAPRPAAPTSAPARPAPTAPRASANNGAAPASAGGAPAVINPSTILPGSSVRPNPTPGR